MNKKIESLLDSTTNCIREVYKDMKESEATRLSRVAQQEQANAEVRQKLFYQQPYPLELDNVQFNAIYQMGAGVIALYPWQSTAIVKHYINQAKQNNDVALLKAMQEEASISLDINFDFVRTLHQKLYECFVHSCFPQATYIEVTPTEYSFLINSSGYHFVYTLPVENSKSFQHLKKKFESFKCSQSYTELSRLYNIKSASINYIGNSHIVIILK